LAISKIQDARRQSADALKGAIGTHDNKRTSMFRILFSLPMASVPLIGESGDFGTSPFFGSSRSN
jgi:hypothetical protein